MAEVGLSIFKGRYLNGAVTFKLSFRKGVLRLNAQDITVKGNPLPSVYMQQIQQTDLAKDAANDPETKASLERFEEIKIENGKLIIVPKKPENDASPPPEESKPESESKK
jgi:hypothetical protein